MSQYIKEGLNALREVRTSALVPVRVAGPSAKMRPLEGRQTSTQARRAVPDIDGPGIPTARQNPLNQPVRLTGPSQRTARRTAVIGAGGFGGLAAALGSDVLRGRQQ